MLFVFWGMKKGRYNELYHTSPAASTQTYIEKLSPEALALPVALPGDLKLLEEAGNRLEDDDGRVVVVKKGLAILAVNVPAHV